MNYGKYKNLRDAAWQCLIDYNVTELPVKIFKIAEMSGIKVVENRNVSGDNKLSQQESGKSIIENGEWFIIFDETKSRGHCKFTVAHELGHIFLGHELKNGKHLRTFDLSKPERETEADMFAARLLAPACVLWALDLHAPEEISKVCNISLTAATNRAKRMDTLYKRNKFLTSPLERQVYENFRGFLINYKNKNKGQYRK